MTTKDEREEVPAELQEKLSASDDEVHASMCAVEKAMGLRPLSSLARKHDAIRQLGCRIVAQALKDDLDRA